MDDAMRAQLRVELKARGLTQVQLARELGISRVHLTRLLTGARGETPNEVKRLIEHLGFKMVLER
ncbi:helix-turn-helix transcriptional regulator [Deinococcus irradiatisoli]|nr:helix-turn-helix transcriptional regulator [Deinococcus irradiatisoli]